MAGIRREDHLAQRANDLPRQLASSAMWLVMSLPEFSHRSNPLFSCRLFPAAFKKTFHPVKYHVPILCGMIGVFLSGIVVLYDS